jgi:ribonuclease HI
VILAKKKKQYYAVVKGRAPGIYRTWFGAGGAAEQVQGIDEALYRGFYTEEEMAAWLAGLPQRMLKRAAPELAACAAETSAVTPSQEAEMQSLLEAGKVVVFTDGSADTKSRRGGYGAVVWRGKKREELSGGLRGTTNNRMELMAVIKALETLQKKSDVVVFSDSQYVVRAMMEGWVDNWRANGWTRDKGQKLMNADLWQALDALNQKHDVEYRWVRGHSGTRENERCDRLAVAAGQGKDLPMDWQG